MLPVGPKVYMAPLSESSDVTPLSNHKPSLIMEVDWVVLSGLLEIICRASNFLWNSVKSYTCVEISDCMIDLSVIIDTGNVDGFNSILEARRLVENSTDEPISIFSPVLSELIQCPQDKFCPRSIRYTKTYKPCTFVQNGHRRKLNFSPEKFSYIIITRNERTGELYISIISTSMSTWSGEDHGSQLLKTTKTKSEVCNQPEFMPTALRSSPAVIRNINGRSSQKLLIT
ncbi:hypothetical protein RF11_00855 [Thelohanellus kitauei]|uniref:Uncharacterized protein n=1 Tax=Thelohanellus kitauei TaxID=669202 RepID=A0A0C2J7F7_THEKT|nr:hypothetical protein RF11_00855 [Thelohanellus kitauei]